VLHRSTRRNISPIAVHSARPLGATLSRSAFTLYVTGITYVRNLTKNDLNGEGRLRGLAAVQPEKNTVNQDDFAGANSNAPVSICQLAIRFIELVAAIACLGLLTPMLLVVAIAIKFDCRGPILVRQTRHGYKNSVILVRKFRVAPACPVGGQKTTRLTLVGQLLRQTGIEELPMLINVIRGEMSLIGLPPSTYPTASLNKRKPGITRWTELFNSQNRRHD
jgi:lipopolysaccharide/colanic/teichoic acid biosynthesis glycosyltransferase